MDAILQLPPDLPPHDAATPEIVPSRVVAEWPRGTFLENLVVLPGGDVIVSVLSEARLDRIDWQGKAHVVRQFDQPTTGVALVDGKLFVAVGEPGAMAPVLWQLDPDNGEGQPWMALDSVQFANGVTPFGPGALLIAESWQGRLVEVDLATRRAMTWFEDERLTRAPTAEFLPGANGVKRFGNEVTVSSNGRALLMRITVNADGSSGAAEVIADRLRVDDFAYDAEGQLYLATHIGHSIDRLDRDMKRLTLAGPAQGMAGSTACAFTADGALLVTTTGGIIAPPGGELEPARLVRLEVGARGHSLDHVWETGL